MPRLIHRMYDSTGIADIPASAEMIAVYADGRYVGTEAEARKRFPHALLVTITVGTQPGREVCDCETGDATPTEAAAWSKREYDAGRLPTIYCNASTWPSVRVEVEKVGMTGKVSYWIAEYDGKAVIPAGAVAKQYLGSPGDSPGHYDVSIVADYWPGVDPKPKPLKPRTLPGHVRAAYWLLTRWLEGYVKRAKKGPVHPLATVTRDHLHRLTTDITAADKADAK